MEILKGEWAPPFGEERYAAYDLRHRGRELVVLPGRGGKIVSLRQSKGDEWLWLNHGLEWLPISSSQRFVEQHDVGGWDECFPTVSPVREPAARWPDHGDLWWRPWTVTREERALQLGVAGERYHFERTIQPARYGFRMDYRLQNRSEEPLDYLWSAHPLFTLAPPLNVEIVGRPELRLGKDGPLGRSGDRHRWPEIEGRPFHHIGKPSGLAVKLFVEPREGRVALIRPSGERLTLRWDVRQLPFLGLWINEGGWSGADLPPYRNLGVEPASGAPDDLVVARDEWRTSCRLEGGAEATWWLTVDIESGS